MNGALVEGDGPASGGGFVAFDDLVSGGGPVAFDSAHVHAYDRIKQAVRMETERPHALRQAIMSCRSGGIVSVIGVYGGFLDKFPAGAWMNRALTLRTGQCHVQRYMKPLLQRIERGERPEAVRGTCDDSPASGIPDGVRVPAPLPAGHRPAHPPESAGDTRAPGPSPPRSPDMPPSLQESSPHQDPLALVRDLIDHQRGQP